MSHRSCLRTGAKGIERIGDARWVVGTSTTSGRKSRCAPQFLSPSAPLVTPPYTGAECAIPARVSKSYRKGAPSKGNMRRAVLLLLVLLPFSNTFGIFFHPQERDALRGLSHEQKEQAVAVRLQSMGAIGDMYNCTCECDVRPFWIYEDVGYGKYCGAEYTCLAGDPGCDSLDDCCRTHDLCVDAAGGYCETCLCMHLSLCSMLEILSLPALLIFLNAGNLALAQCAGATSGPGFCGKLEEARTAVLDDICFVLKYAPHWCGGCASNATLPAVCQNYTLHW